MPQLQTYRSQGHRGTEKPSRLYGQERTLTMMQAWADFLEIEAHEEGQPILHSTPGGLDWKASSHLVWPYRRQFCYFLENYPV
jgi:hypothetical protein